MRAARLGSPARTSAVLLGAALVLLLLLLAALPTRQRAPPPCPTARDAAQPQQPGAHTGRHRRWNVVLAVMFNVEPRPHVAAFLHELYTPHFAQVVLVGPPLAPPEAAAAAAVGPAAGADGAAAAEGVPGLTRTPDGLPYLACDDDCRPPVSSTFGYWCAAQLLQALQLGGDRWAEGLLWVHDDVAFRLSLLERLSLSSTWYFPAQVALDLDGLASQGGIEDAAPYIPPSRMHADAASTRDHANGWVWWRAQLDCPSAFAPPGGGHYPVGLQALAAAWAALPERCRRHFDAKWGGRCPTAQVADAFYLAAAHSSAFVDLARHFRTHNVFMEVATPAILDYVGDLPGAHGAGRPELLRGLWVWYDRDNLTAILGEETAAHLVDLVHPLKCSQPAAMAQLAGFFYS